MIEQDIEKKIIDRINALGLQDVDVIGLWQPTDEGVLKCLEKSQSVAGIVVKVSPRQFDTFGISDVSMTVNIVLSVRIDKCPTGTLLVDYYNKIENLVQEWNLKQTGQELEDFTVDGFYPGGLDAGANGPDLNRDTMSWTVSWTITLRGAVSFTV